MFSLIKLLYKKVLLDRFISIKVELLKFEKLNRLLVIELLKNFASVKLL
jgi:hypothetical protein